MKRIAVLLVAAVLAGCSSSGVQVKEEQMTQFQPGKTTIADVVKALGQPQHQTLMSDGTRHLVYSYAQIRTRPETFIPFVGAFIGGADMKTNTASFAFGQDGVLKASTASSGATGAGLGFASGVGAQDRVQDQPAQ